MKTGSIYLIIITFFLSSCAGFQKKQLTDANKFISIDIPKNWIVDRNIELGGGSFIQITIPNEPQNSSLLIECSNISTVWDQNDMEKVEAAMKHDGMKDVNIKKTNLENSEVIVIKCSQEKGGYTFLLEMRTINNPNREESVTLTYTHLEGDGQALNHKAFDRISKDLSK
ncbi:MAG: hypothetical protein ACPGYY_05185 [Bacteroidia bacterium]